ncbi:MAG: hypothetical protein EXS05_09655 [Planctomycetaceae bacterium]|nr:hypothetical protein [Planctomycetaceae bacterium]
MPVATRRQSAAGVLVLSLLGWSVVSSLWYFPHSLSYFNELAGGPTNGPFHLINTNIDWGQDLPFLKKWLERNPQARPLHLAYFGTYNPKHAGIEHRLAPMRALAGRPTEFPYTGPQPGWHAISVTLLRGHPWAVPDHEGNWHPADQQAYTYFQRLEPVAIAGYSIYIYHLTLDDANRLRAEMGLPLLNVEPASSPVRE